MGHSLMDPQFKHALTCLLNVTFKMVVSYVMLTDECIYTGSHVQQTSTSFTLSFCGIFAS